LVEQVVAIARAGVDKSKLPPGDLILTNYFRVEDGKICELYTVRLA
jgi:hypothetical protein